MALMNDEAELAGVLGHEVGHVAAQHSKKRQSAATRNSILGVLGAVLGSAIGGEGGLLGSLGGLLQNNAMQVAQLATLGFSRSQELEADRSEEQTSELQSLMRISYAVFCLKKKNTKR